MSFSFVNKMLRHAVTCTTRLSPCSNITSGLMTLLICGGNNNINILLAMVRKTVVSLTKATILIISQINLENMIYLGLQFFSWACIRNNALGYESH